MLNTAEDVLKALWRVVAKQTLEFIGEHHTEVAGSKAAVWIYYSAAAALALATCAWLYRRLRLKR